MNPFHFLEVPRSEPEETPAYERARTMREISERYDAAQAAAQARRCLDCGNPYCQWDCPVANQIPQWLKLVADGRLFQAAELSHQTNSLPEICGRICPQDRLCEGACTLHEGFGAVTIGAIEQYITEEALAAGWRPSAPPLTSDRKVAVIGAGPAGLGCADILIRNGVQPVVFDRHPRIGGLLTFGIPPFKLDKAVVERRRGLLQDMGVKFELGVEVGRDIDFAELDRAYDAIFVGTGAYTAVTAPLPGLDQPGVVPALPFLIRNAEAVLGLNERRPEDLTGQSVVVLGGGDTAMDCVRTSVRLGARQVRCVYRRTEADMPGSRKEVKNAREEGVYFEFQAAPLRVDKVGDRLQLTLQRTEPGPRGADGRRSQQAVPDSETTLTADRIIVAFGYRPSPPAWLPAEVELADDGRIETGRQRLLGQTSHPKLFAGGDAVRGADLVVRAIYDGRMAAQSILSYLQRDAQSD